MDMHMANFLMGNSSIILQNIVVLRTHSEGEFLGDREELSEFGVWDIMEFFGMGLRDYELYL